MENSKKFEVPRAPEMNERAREVILAFQKAKVAKNETEQAQLIQVFYQKLMKIVTPENEEFFQKIEKDLADIVLEGKDPQYLSVGGGTAGQRIIFKNSIIIQNQSEQAKYGFDLQSNEFNELESQDGKPRWMVYGKPESHGQRYWERFIGAFGDEVVDLLQAIK